MRTPWKLRASATETSPPPLMSGMWRAAAAAAGVCTPILLGFHRGYREGPNSCEVSHSWLWAGEGKHRNPGFPQAKEVFSTPRVSPSISWKSSQQEVCTMTWQGFTKFLLHANLCCRCVRFMSTQLKNASSAHPIVWDCDRQPGQTSTTELCKRQLRIS